MAFFHSPLPSRSEWTTIGRNCCLAVRISPTLRRKLEIRERIFPFFFFEIEHRSINRDTKDDDRRTLTFDERRVFLEYSVKNQSFRRIDITSSNMANTKEKAWRERGRERVDGSQIGTAARNCYKSCSRRFAAIEFRTVREFHPLQGVNISQNYL